MLTITIRLASPNPDAPIDICAIRSLVTTSALPEDRVEHVHVQAAMGGGVDVVLFISGANLGFAQVSGTALSSRLLHDCLPGWRLQRVLLEPFI